VYNGGYASHGGYIPGCVTGYATLGVYSLGTMRRVLSAVFGRERDNEARLIPILPKNGW